MALLWLSATAQEDMANILSWTKQRHGDGAAERYSHLLALALRTLAADSFCLGTKGRPEIGDELRSYHLRSLRKTAGVARPRHLVLYKIRRPDIVVVGRVLHDAMELERHAEFDLPPNA